MLGLIRLARVSASTPWAELPALPEVTTQTAEEPDAVPEGDAPPSAYSFVADAEVGEVLRRKRFASPGNPAYDFDDMKWGETGVDHTVEERRQFEELLEEFRDIFTGEAVPRPCDVQPVHIELKPGVDVNKLPWAWRQHWKKNEEHYLRKLCSSGRPTASS